MNRREIIVYLVIVCLSIATKAAYSPPVALQLAYMSAIAYQNTNSIDKWNCTFCQLYKINSPKGFLNTTNGIGGFTGYSLSLNSIIISFRGADNASSFIENLRNTKIVYDKCSGCQVSQDFYQWYLSVQPTVLKQIQNLHRIYRNAKLIVTGHGLGGSLAMLASIDTTLLYGITDAVYTFGACRIGNSQFASFYNGKVPETFRVINYGDILPHLPMSSVGYIHSSWEEWYLQGMKTYKTCQGESANCSNSLPSSELNVPDNSISNYLKLYVQNLLALGSN